MPGICSLAIVFLTPEVVRKEHFYLFDAEGVKFPLAYFCQAGKKQQKKTGKENSLESAVNPLVKDPNS